MKIMLGGQGNENLSHCHIVIVMCYSLWQIKGNHLFIFHVICLEGV